MSRGWTEIPHPNWQDEDYYDKVKPELDALASEWSRIHDEVEYELLLREDREDFEYDPEMDAIDEVVDKTRTMLRRVQTEAIEKRMEELGARMMRPYEHWNEDERYMQYMENRGY